MLCADSYTLQYEVTVDTEETGFQYGKDYPANGTTTLTYTDGEGNPGSNPIEVPEVDANGTAYGDAVELNEANGWSYQWTGLVVGATYTVDEVSVPAGYVKTISGYTITNTLPEEEIPEEEPPLSDLPERDPSEEEIPEEDPPLAEVPATGDMSALWMASSALSAAGIFVLNKKNKDEE